MHRLGDRSAALTLVNTNALVPREVIIQAGVFGEHVFESVTLEGERSAARGRWLHVTLVPGATAELELGMRRYDSLPSYDTPWVQAADGPAPIVGRET